MARSPYDRSLEANTKTRLYMIGQWVLPGGKWVLQRYFIILMIKALNILFVFNGLSYILVVVVVLDSFIIQRLIVVHILYTIDRSYEHYKYIYYIVSILKICLSHVIAVMCCAWVMV